MCTHIHREMDEMTQIATAVFATERKKSCILLFTSAEAHSFKWMIKTSSSPHLTSQQPLWTNLFKSCVNGTDAVPQPMETMMYKQYYNVTVIDNGEMAQAWVLPEL